MSKKTLVLGASLNPTRYSNLVVHRLLNNGHEVLAFGLRKGHIDSVEINTELLPFKNVDTVTLYIGPKNHGDYIDYVIGLNPKRVIFNPGTENSEFYQKLSDNGIQTEVACTLVLLSTNQY